MKTTGMMVLLLALLATGLTALPTDPSFDVTVNQTSQVAPNGQLPDAEVGLNYSGANVTFVANQKTQPSFVFDHFWLDGSATTNPPGISIQFDNYTWVGKLVGVPTAAGTYTIGINTVWINTITLSPEDGVVQFYTIVVRPAGYGVTYPPPPSSSSSSDGGGGDDSSCSTIEGANMSLPAALITILGALVWRRRRDTIELRG